jgi:secreted trypsin-like serine protease
MIYISKALAILATSFVAFGGWTADARPSPDAYKQIKIVGGGPAGVGEFPFAVNLHYRNSSFCGGTLISDRWILTAAHCIVDTTSSFKAGKNQQYATGNISVNIGNLRNSTTKPVSIKRVIPHPEYHYAKNINDIGLIELQKPVTLSETIQPVKILLNSSHLASDQNYTVIGWGRNEKNQKSSYLQQVDIPAADDLVCGKAWIDYFKYRDQVICAGNELGKDSCRGDSGGPLLVRLYGTNSTGEAAANAWAQAGITSFGENSLGLDPSSCGIAGAIGYYTRADYFVEWISHTTGLPISSFATLPPESFSTRQNITDWINTTNAERSNIITKTASSHAGTNYSVSFTGSTFILTMIITWLLKQLDL